jgi:hypothetical protein
MLMIWPDRWLSTAYELLWAVATVAACCCGSVLSNTIANVMLAPDATMMAATDNRLAVSHLQHAAVRTCIQARQQRVLHGSK